jgi:predicted AlkP superfamily pyrophosphatase or phosphodiesterase
VAIFGSALLSRLGALSLAALACAQAAPAFAEEAPAAAPAQKAPSLIVAISIDQFSADLFAEYRSHYTGGLARLLKGAVFPAGFQSHAATETCPGHSTLLTGVHPARTGIIANTWIDLSLKRADKKVYCVEDESNPDSTPNKPVVSTAHLKVPTLGEWAKKQWPASRNVAVSAKDRAVAMMGGHQIDAGFWYVGDAFTSFAGRALPVEVTDENKRIRALLDKGAPAMAIPAWCVARNQAVQAGAVTVGTGRFVLGDKEDKRKLGDQLRYSPRMDAATLELAASLLSSMKLGKGQAPDILSVSLSANDYVGHAYGTEGLEMCIQQQQLDQKLGEFFAKLDASGVDYAVVLSADHGGVDTPERLRLQGVPEAARGEAVLNGEGLGRAIAAELGISGSFAACNPGPDVAGNIICSDGLSGDYWISPDLSAETRAKVAARLVEKLKAHRQVEAVFTKAEIAAVPYPVGHPQDWTLLQRARASFDPQRSGDVYSVLKRAIVPVTTPRANATTITTHGSVWDYDRRVPMLFWRKGMTGFEQPQPVETVDIAPTLAALIGLKVPQGTFDGRCLDLDAGPADTCR